MKKIVAIVALLASLPAAAFWGWGDGTWNGDELGYADTAGTGEADFSFDFSMTARLRGDARGYGNGNGGAYQQGYGYASQIPYYGAPYGFPPPVAAPQTRTE